jgi:gliding motility-associated-like protein
MKALFLVFIIIITAPKAFCQDIDLKSQFNGRYDFTAIGNTLNLEENESATSCQILTQSSASLNLNASQNIQAAYLYWAGSGPGDFDVELNGQAVSAQQTFGYTLDSFREFFAAFADVTSQVSDQGSVNYTLSELDLTEDIGQYYCQTGTNFGGWSIIVIYEDQSLPLNQVSVYDGLQAVSIDNTSVTINLDNLNVIDNEGAKIGFLAWEGDQQLAVNESLVINGGTISNPPLNPSDNAFNGTNSFTGSSNLYNMDLDVYDIENNIDPGDESATIVLNSGNGIVSSDFVMVNNIVTVLNSELPEPEPEIEMVENSCDRDSITIGYTVNNFNSTAPLPAENPITFLANNSLLGSTTTQDEIPIDGTESGQATFALPTSIDDGFVLQMLVNTLPNGDLAVNEINPDNNFTQQNVNIEILSIADPLQDLSTCDDPSNDSKAIFNLNVNKELAIGNQEDVEVQFFRTQNDAENDDNPILNPGSFENENTPQIIYLRLSVPGNNDCVIIRPFTIDVFYQPLETDLSDLSECKPLSSNVSILFNLEEKISEIQQSQPNTVITFFTSETGALNNQNPIEETQNYQAPNYPITIWVRISAASENSCFAVSSFQLNVNNTEVRVLDSLQNCDEGLDQAYFDLTQVESQIDISGNQILKGYFTSLADAVSNEQNILIPSDFQSKDNPQNIYVRVGLEENCDAYYSFLIGVENCPPFIPEGFSPNDDGINDRFFISGLFDIFPDFRIKVFSRYGNIIYEGNNDIESWDGTANRGLMGKGSQLPTGTYYYVLNLNDPDYQIYKGWVYLNR